MIKAILHQIGGLTKLPVSQVLLWFTVFGIFTFLTVYLIFIFKKNKNLHKHYSILDKILAVYRPGQGLEEGLNSLLSLLVSLVKVPGYYFYVLDNKKDSYVLRAFRYFNSEEANIQPSYAGLVPYQKENYTPPLVLTDRQELIQPANIKEGDLSFVDIPVQGGKGIIRIGPCSGKTVIDMELMAFLGEKLEPVLESLWEVEKMKEELEVIVGSSKAIRVVKDAATNYNGNIQAILGLSMKMVGAKGACFWKGGKTNPEVVAAYGLEPDMESLLRDDMESITDIMSLVSESSYRIVSKEEKEYCQIPSYLTAAGAEMFLLIKVPMKEHIGIALFWFNQIYFLEEPRISALTMVISRVGDTLDSYNKIKELSQFYLDVLKSLVSTLDNIDPYMVGYSDLMARYAGVIAREMGLDEETKKNVILAAYLSNIGVLGISQNLLLKQGKYSEFEYETMKLHADIGASIVEVTLGDVNIASYIRHHHERIDGYGYPSGLKGEEIPLGARIIGAAQFFLAKIIGRKYREPLTFEQAITHMKSAAGTQLDGTVVEALISWFEKKQLDSSLAGHSLGPCWEMRCSPMDICSSCPAFKNREKNCWEFEGVCCLTHGNKCSSCFIYTEYIYRTQKLNIKPEK